MRSLIIPLLAAGVVFASAGDEPSERQMRGAFEQSLAAQVRNAMQFVNDTGGAEALAKVHEAGTDRFDIHAFRKQGCIRAVDAAGHLCAFTVEVGVVNGALHRSLSGRFHTSTGGLAFTPAI